MRHAGYMTSGDDMGERDDIPELAAAIDELRSLLRAFDDVRPSDWTNASTSMPTTNWTWLAGRSSTLSTESGTQTRGCGASRWLSRTGTLHHP